MRLIHILLIPFLLFNLISANAADLKEIEQDISDSVITAKITAKFTKNPRLNPLKISVTTMDGIVTLSGNVHDASAFFEALKLVKETKGVKYVDTNDLEIKDVNTIFTDAYITTKVQAAILRAKIFEDDSIPLVGINSTTTNGIVTLTGEVKNQKSLFIILDRVSKIHGVKQVISNLEINDGTSDKNSNQIKDKLVPIMDAPISSNHE